MKDADTTPLARAAALVHDAQRTYDAIAVGPQWAKRPWDEQSDEDKKRIMRFVERAAGSSFEDFYEFFTMPERMTGQTVAPATDSDNASVRYARMVHSISTALLPA